MDTQTLESNLATPRLKIALVNLLVDLIPEILLCVVTRIFNAVFFVTGGKNGSACETNLNADRKTATFVAYSNRKQQ